MVVNAINNIYIHEVDRKMISIIYNDMNGLVYNFT